MSNLPSKITRHVKKLQGGGWGCQDQSIEPDLQMTEMMELTEDFKIVIINVTLIFREREENISII